MKPILYTWLLIYVLFAAFMGAANPASWDSTTQALAGVLCAVAGVAIAVGDWLGRRFNR